MWNPRQIINLCALAPLTVTKKNFFPLFTLTIFFRSSITQLSSPWLREVISKDAPFATSHFLRGLGSLLSGFAAWHFYFSLSFGADNDPGREWSFPDVGVLFYVETHGLWPRLLPILSLLVRSVKRSLRITNLIKVKTDFTLGCPN